MLAGRRSAACWSPRPGSRGRRRSTSPRSPSRSRCSMRCSAVPPPADAEAVEPERDRRRPALCDEPSRARSARTCVDIVGDVLRHAAGAVPGDRREASAARRAGPALRGARRRRADRVTPTSGWMQSRQPARARRRVRGRRRGGSASIAFGFAPASLWLVLVFLAVAGGADAISGIFRRVDVERDDPGRAPRPPREHRDDQLLDRPAARQRRGRRRSLAHGRALRRSSRAACCASSAPPPARCCFPAFWRYEAPRSASSSSSSPSSLR